MRKAAGLVLFAFALPLALSLAPAQTVPAPSQALDARVRDFLASQKGQWRQENVTETDGRLLHDLIIERGYKRALEIGTSTGHSGIWQAWALSKTGGSLVTVEIEEFRHLAAVRNFKSAGLDAFIDARLGDAHALVETIEGPFDFIFIDADQNWTLNYFEALLPKLAPGGCFAVHNVVSLGYMKGVRDFLERVRALDLLETRIEPSSGGGISLSFKNRN
jgi:predicted O-methyltransferase YrrM